MISLVCTIHFVGLVSETVQVFLGAQAFELQ